MHRPDGGGPYPVLVWRTPYGKHKKQFEQYVKGGYIVVCQDVRGRYASDGTWESWLRPETHDAEDGYDTVQWAARLPGRERQSGHDRLLVWRLLPVEAGGVAAAGPGRHVGPQHPGHLPGA